MTSPTTSRAARPGPGRASRLGFALALLLMVAPAPAGRTAPAPATAPPATPPPHRVTSLDQEPGFRPAADSESMSVVLGRRVNAPPVSKLFRGGAPSLDSLGSAVCRAIHHGRGDSLLALCVTDDEFRDTLWREFPQSRPATGLTWVDAWTILYARLHAGCSHALRDEGGHYYRFLRFEGDSVMAYRNFKLHNHLTLVVLDDAGQIQSWKWIRSVAERKGRFKIYSTED